WHETACGGRRFPASRSRGRRRDESAGRANPLLEGSLCLDRLRRDRRPVFIGRARRGRVAMELPAAPAFRRRRPGVLLQLPAQDLVLCRRPHLARCHRLWRLLSGEDAGLVDRRPGLPVAYRFDHVLLRRPAHLARGDWRVSRPHLRGGEGPAALPRRRRSRFAAPAGGSVNASQPCRRLAEGVVCASPLMASGGNVILCADDFGMAPGISEAILSLAEGRRLSATSALVTGPLWPRYGPMIARLRNRVAVGLHINLSFGRPLGAMPRLAP